MHGVWNLDFFRTVLPPTCLDISTLQALTLDYAIALYPLVLVMLTYFLIELHDSDCVLIVWIFRPFHKCATVKSSVVIVFSTFLRLSYAKLISVSFDLLVPVWAYDKIGQSVGVYLYCDATIEYFGKDHLPYALLASFVLVVFIVAPIILLIIYPLRCCSFLRKWSALQVFLDTYQGYKDGTNGTLDCRWFSCVYLLVRLLLLSMFNFITNSYFYALASLVFLLMTLLHVVVKPYRESFNKYNKVHALLSLNLAMLFMTIVCIDISSTFCSFHTKIFSIVVCGLFLTSPLIYASGHLLNRIFFTFNWMLPYQKFNMITTMFERHYECYRSLHA